MTRLKERIENFNKAYGIFSDAVNEYKKDTDAVLIQMALVQSFEVCFELAWKVLKDYLNIKGLQVYLPRDVIKGAFSAEVIQNGQVWINMLNARNSTSHEYNNDKINIILRSISTEYAKELADFEEQIKGFDE